MVRERHITNSLKAQLSASGASTANVDGEYLVSMLSRGDVPEPFECLELIETVYRSKCEILESAKQSSKEVNSFSRSRQLIDMLIRLVTGYRDILIEKGDSEARKVFGNNGYAARESESVMNDDSMRRAREFFYNGETVSMFRHLKIGVADDFSKTIRVHFYWDGVKEKIVIGCCGKHLPVLSH